MQIILSKHDPNPIYLQITVQIQAQILDGTLAKGTELPSIRALANNLHVSVITTKRAYQELQRSGFVETVAGKATYVVDSLSYTFRETQLLELEKELDALALRAPQLSLSQDEFLSAAEESYAQAAEHSPGVEGSGDPSTHVPAAAHDSPNLKPVSTPQGSKSKGV